MEQFFKDPQTLRQKREGPLGAHIDEFAQQLSEQGYSQQCACRRLQLIAELSRWLWQREWAVKDLTVTKVENFLRFRVWPRPVRRGDAAGLKAFLGWLRQKPIRSLRQPPGKVWSRHRSAPSKRQRWASY